VLTPEEYLSPNHPAELLFEERHVVVGWAENPLLAAPLTVADFLGSAHVAVTIGPSRQLTYAEQHLQSLTSDRLVEIYAPSFSVVPWLLIGTQRLTVMHERLAKVFADNLPLRLQSLPIVVPSMREMLQFHEARSNDSGVTWLRQLLLETASGMGI
jgi:DNA-binding transcriptional LysR family regulator